MVLRSLQVRNLSKSYGTKTVLDKVSFVVNEGECVGLIGANGSGKSTLLRCVVGAEAPDSGEIVVSPAGTRLGYLPQALLEIADMSVREALEGAQAEAREAELALQQAAESLGSADAAEAEAALAAYDVALARFEALGGYEREHRADAVLDGLGLSDIDRELPVAMLSGGQKTRLGMAILLLGEPDILLLDEPTNHLDVDALGWLEAFIRDFAGGVLLVSHDREFLDQTVERVLHLDPASHGLRGYAGDYSDFTTAREHEAQLRHDTWVQQEKYVAQVASDIGRLKGEALAIELSTTPRQPGVRRLARKKAGLAKSREKKLQRFLASDERIEKAKPQWGLKLDFGEPPAGGRSVLHLDEVGFAYPDSPPLFTELNLDVRHQDRIALVGPNGAGKTTLLRLIAGELRPTHGLIRIGANVRLGVLAQEQQTLDSERSVLETALRERPMDQTEARSFLHFFLFGGDDVFRAVGDCSFGERTRLQLALLVLRGCNLLLLDEPLNHLDIEGREHFEQALDAFEGTIIAVVHDRAFLRSFAERVVLLADGHARLVEGGYEVVEALTP